MSQYSDDDAICHECVVDKHLQNIILNKNTLLDCIECGNTNPAMTLLELVKLIDPIIQEHFQQGEYERHFSPDDDSYDVEQSGDSLVEIVNSIFGQEFDFVDCLKDLLIENDPVDVRGGDSPFYDDSSSYVNTKVDIYELHVEWRALENELKTRRRFFNDDAKKLFDWLFKDIEDLLVYGKVTSSVIQELPIDTELFRARRADLLDNCKQFILNPSQELAPPPIQYAQAGRMNAKGVTTFYGALDEQTCLSEMRSSIGSYIVLGRFKTLKPLRILSFSQLEKAVPKDGLSYFQEDFEDQVIRHKFLGQIHSLISKPIITGHEDDYLMTQVLAEYLGHGRHQSFDGLSFKSTQYQGGTNIVLFPKPVHLVPSNVTDTLQLFDLSYVEESVEIQQTKHISYDIQKVRYKFYGDELYLDPNYHGWD